MHVSVQQQLAKMFAGHQELKDIGVEDANLNI